MSIKIVLATAGLAIVGMTSSAASFAASETQIDTRVSETLLYFNSINPENRVLGDKAAGVLVFPRVTKGGVGVAGEFGEGVLQVNGKTVGYYSVGAASVGLTLGLAKHSEIIMFMTQDSLTGSPPATVGRLVRMRESPWFPVAQAALTTHRLSRSRFSGLSSPRRA